MPSLPQLLPRPVDRARLERWAARLELRRRPADTAHGPAVAPAAAPAAAVRRPATVRSVLEAAGPATAGPSPSPGVGALVRTTAPEVPPEARRRFARLLPPTAEEAQRLEPGRADTTVTLHHGRRLAARSMVAEPLAEGERTAATGEVLAALSRLLDLAEGHTPGSAIRTCFLALRLASALDLPDRDRSALFYAALLKDAGGSANAADLVRVFGTSDLAQKRHAALSDPRSLVSGLSYQLLHAPGGSVRGTVERLRDLASGEGRDVRVIANDVRAEQGAEIAGRLGLPPEVREAIHGQAERWDASAAATARTPEHHLLGRILALAAGADVAVSRRGPRAGELLLRRRAGHLYDPALVELLVGMGRLGLWTELGAPELTSRTLALEPARLRRRSDEADLDRICAVFGEIGDAKSPFTAGASARVAARVEQAAGILGLGRSLARDLRRAAHLRDLGKLALPNTILDRPGPLSEEEWTAVRRHPATVAEALRPIPALADVAELVGRHHERSRGGYGIEARSKELDGAVALLAAADALTALTSDRAHRPAVDEDGALAALARAASSEDELSAIAALRAKG